MYYDFYWYYVGIPVLVLQMIIVIIWLIYRQRRIRERREALERVIRNQQFQQANVNAQILQQQQANQYWATTAQQQQQQQSYYGPPAYSQEQPQPATTNKPSAWGNRV